MEITYCRKKPLQNHGTKTSTAHESTKNSKTLIIGSSILKGIKTKGLINTDICTNRGADIITLIKVIEGKNLADYKSIIIHIGGNDLSNGYTLNSIYENYLSLLYLLRAKSNKDTVLMVSGMPPRWGTNVQALNMLLKDLCDNLNLQFIDHTMEFHDTNGYVKHELLHSDGIHLSKKGTSTFLHNINNYVQIMRSRVKSTWYCFYCGEGGHNKQTCRHGQAVLCYCCNSYGHKEKFCKLYSC